MRVIIVAVLIMIAAGCSSPLAPAPDFIVFSGELNELTYTHLYVLGNGYPGYFIDTDVELQKSVFTLFVSGVGGTWEPSYKILETRLFIFYDNRYMTSQSEYVLNITKEK